MLTIVSCQSKEYLPLIERDYMYVLLLCLLCLLLIY